MKKLVTLLLALVLLLTMAAPALAEDTYTITINNSTAGHTYEAYQIFSGRLDVVNGNKILSDIVWGNGVDQTKAVNGKTLSQVFDGKTAEEIAETLKTEEDAKTFAAEGCALSDESYYQRRTGGRQVCHFWPDRRLLSGEG